MPNLYNKLMAKDMPRAAAAPTSRQMVQAPMGLRSAMKRYADGGELSSFSGDDGRSNQSLSFPQLSDPDEVRRYEIAKIMQEMDTKRPPEPARYSPELVRPPEAVRPPPPPPEEPRYQPEKLQPERPDVRPVMPEIYPQDYAGPRTTGSTQTQQVGPRTSYRQEADGTMTEIGYDGQPISGYTAQQLAMHNATTGVTPSEFQYVWNGQGYDKVRTGGVTLDDGTFIAGADNGQGGMDIGGPAFFQKYADDPMTMARLRELYGFTGAEPEYRQPEIGFSPNASYQEPVAPQIPFNPADVPTNGYNEPEVNFNLPEKAFDAQAYRDIQTDKESERLNLLKQALSGQGVGSLMESQRLAQLLQNLGYSK